jgi:23S rRNA (guanosine2251-2'-O)-methyltransferase
MKEPTQYLYGKHTLEEALAYRPDVIAQVLFSSDFDDDSLRHRVGNTDIKTQTFGAKHPPGGIKETDVHQGVFIRVNTDKLTQSYDDFREDLTVTSKTSLVVLGELQDPHNVGAVIRNAAAFGVDGVLIPKHNQAQVTAAVVKVSAGTAFQVPLISIGNVNQTITDLKERDFWIYGLDDDASETLPEQTFSTPTVFVLGNEAEGIREKTKEHCDKLIKIPTAGGQSLNAAAATAVAFYVQNQRAA